MIDGLLIINDSGALLYNWHPENYEGDGKDDLFSGFLTAIDSFATIERGEDIKSLKLKETSLIFEKIDEFEQQLFLLYFLWIVWGIYICPIITAFFISNMFIKINCH